MAAAEAEATKNNWGVAIAIVDSGGNLVMLHRLENAQLSATRIAEAKPDLVLLDWMLPTLSGIEVCRQLRRRQ